LKIEIHVISVLLFVNCVTETEVTELIKSRAFFLGVRWDTPYPHIFQAYKNKIVFICFTSTYMLKKTYEFCVNIKKNMYFSKNANSQVLPLRIFVK
jgi:hypothetical protein